MLVILSPAKSQDFETKVTGFKCSDITFKNETLKVLANLKKRSVSELEKLLEVSKKIADLNAKRFKNFKKSFTESNSKPALFAYTGDVYQGLSANDLSKADVNFLQKHLRIITGFYGLLKPLDLIQAYRLEMKNKLSVEGSKNLYDFWGDKLTAMLISDAKKNKSDFIVNLASNEYAKAINFKKLGLNVVTPVFKDNTKGDYKVVAIFAKKARGLMVNFIAKNKVKDIDALKKFNLEGYKFSVKDSSANELVFLRKH